MRPSLILRSTGPRYASLRSDIDPPRRGYLTSPQASPRIAPFSHHLFAAPAGPNVELTHHTCHTPAGAATESTPKGASMQPLFRKSVWLAAAIAAALSLPFGSVLAHEGREVGEYRFVVGWIEEPTYEGLKNGVELRVTKTGEAVQTGHGHDAEDDGDSSGGRPRGGGPCRRPGGDPAGGGDPRAFRSVEGDEPARPSSTSPDTTRQTSYQRPRGSTSSVYSAQPRVPRSTRPSFREEEAVVSTTSDRRRTCSFLRDFPRYARSRAR